MFAPRRRRELALMVNDTLPDDADRIEKLQVDIRRLEALIALVNDALFGLAGILGQAIVEAGVTNRIELADAIEQRAGLAGNEDHNQLLLAFA
jgi:hypothetical protein